MNIYAAMIGMFVLAFGSGYLACELIHRLREPKGTSVELETTFDGGVIFTREPTEPIPEPTAFAVAGKPKKPPFRERKKDLKAAARTERKKREEWKD